MCFHNVNEVRGGLKEWRIEGGKLRWQNLKVRKTMLEKNWRAKYSKFLIFVEIILVQNWIEMALVCPFPVKQQLVREKSLEMFHSSLIYFVVIREREIFLSCQRFFTIFQNWFSLTFWGKQGWCAQNNIQRLRVASAKSIQDFTTYRFVFFESNKQFTANFFYMKNKTISKKTCSRLGTLKINLVLLFELKGNTRYRLLGIIIVSKGFWIIYVS